MAPRPGLVGRRGGAGGAAVELAVEVLRGTGAAAAAGDAA